MKSQEITIKARQWLSPAFDENTRNQVQNLLNNNEEELYESFYKNLEFGTGGLRGIMGVGTNRMNKYTVGMATQGLSNYLKKNFAGLPEIKVAIAYDSRNNSRYFAEITAAVFSANGIRVYLFNKLRPTPELSFAVRHLGCQSGVVITASHNPKEYNGYKVYWDDGGQIVSPHDKNIIAEVNQVTDPSQVNFDADTKKIVGIGTEVDDAYFREVEKLVFNKDIIRKHADLKIVFTALHGTGITLLPIVLNALGFTNVILEEQQAIPDGNFPTVSSPNPENREALEMAIAKAQTEDAEIVLATDPDADRIAMAVKDDDGYKLLNGNQTASLLTDYVLEQWQKNNKLTGNEFTVKTIVTTELMKAISESYGVPSYDVLTGFKYIAAVIRRNEGKARFICGGEESYGFLTGDFVRDKDAISTAVLIAELFTYVKENGQTLLQRLEAIYQKHGFYYETLVNVVKEGAEGAVAIERMMADFRQNPPAIQGESPEMVLDYRGQICQNLKTGVDEKLEGFPVSNVLQFFYADGTKISVRPSGTEPKIKFYFGVKMPADDSMKNLESKANRKFEMIKKELGL